MNLLAPCISIDCRHALLTFYWLTQQHKWLTVTLWVYDCNTWSIFSAISNTDKTLADNDDDNDNMPTVPRPPDFRWRHQTIHRKSVSKRSEFSTARTKNNTLGEHCSQWIVKQQQSMHWIYIEYTANTLLSLYFTYQDRINIHPSHYDYAKFQTFSLISTLKCHPL